MSRWLLVLLLFPLLGWAEQPGERTVGDHVHVRWLAPDTFARGQTETIGFYFEVDPGWHVYWRNPGDSGAAPRFDVASQGAVTGAVQWPFPKRLPIEHLTNLGYEGDVTYLLPVTPDSDAERLVLDVALEWLVCKVDCIPGFGTLKLSRSIGNETFWQSRALELRDHFLARVPRDTAVPWNSVRLIELEDGDLRLSLDGIEPALATLQVFPLAPDLLTAAAPLFQQQGQQLLFEFKRVPGAKTPQVTDFVVTDGQQAWRLDSVPISARQSNTDNIYPSEAATKPLWLLLLAAIAGGMILNLMPCVFPVLSIKMMSLVQADVPHRLREALLYSAGVLVTFLALGGALLALRAAGGAIGWGFQLQSAPVVLGLILLFWMMALSFSGVFEFGHRLMSMASGSQGGAFVTGILAVFVATPCTGPFMGAALGAAAVLPTPQALTLFLGLGAGLASPFIVLSLCPPFLKLLPKPGEWMVTLRQFLAFPLYATVIWLLWVLGRLVGDTGWLMGALMMLSVAFSLWLWPRWGRGGRVAAGVVVVLALVGAFGTVTDPKASPSSGTQTPSAWQPYSADVIARAQASGQSVFVDFTAAWCITCQVNKKLVLDTEAVQALFRQYDVLLVRADWTHHNPEITEALAQLGRNSVPVYAWYPAGAVQPELLPQLLQIKMIQSLFSAQATRH